MSINNEILTSWLELTSNDKRLTLNIMEMILNQSANKIIVFGCHKIIYSGFNSAIAFNTYAQAQHDLMHQSKSQNESIADVSIHRVHPDSSITEMGRTSPKS